MMDLIGKDCAVEFDLPHTDWPIQGFPARVRVLDVALPMIKMVSWWGGTELWINLSKVKSIRAEQIRVSGELESYTT